MTNSSIIKPGSIVKMHYSLTLENGFIVDSTAEGEAFSFTIGEGSLEPELESVLLGLTPSAKKMFMFNAGDVFGISDPTAVQVMPRSEFVDVDSTTLQKGMMLGFDLPSGEEVSGLIVDLDVDSVTVDFNHPLSGRAFIFEVEILSVN